MITYFKTLWTDPAAARKFYVTVIGVVLLVLTSGVTADMSWQQWAVAILTALGVYVVPNRAVDNG